MPPVGLDCFQSNQECWKHHFYVGLPVLPDAMSHLDGEEKLHQHPCRGMELPQTFIQSNYQGDLRNLFRV